ncbi:hypothetical protein [Nitrobacter winogradskyi]|nr:hypothetical protein [Nitrobacter winogradskyi]
MNSALGWISIGLSILWPLALLLGRNWIKARIESSVRHGFELKIEAVRSELRANEEKIRSQLREKEQEISTLRQTVLNGTANRQSLFDKRRFEAVEKVWASVNDYSKLLWVSSTIAIMKVEAVAAEASDPKMQRVLAAMGQNPPDLKDLQDAKNERPFLSETAWAYYSAYTSILVGNYTVFKILQTGVSDPLRFINRDGNKEILKAALPHQVGYIEKYGAQGYHHLLGEIQSLLLAELINMLNGKETDRERVENARGLLKVIQRTEDERGQTEHVAAAV